MAIVYLTWGETPRSYGVFGSQVIGQFIKIANLFVEERAYFISGLPVIHSGMVREKLGYFKELAKIRSLLDNIEFDWIPIFATQNFVNSNKITFKIFHNSLSHFFLYKKLKKIDAKLVHCRSYHATWAAIAVRKKYKLDFKIIFDGRDLWPEEVALKKGWQESSGGYQYLKSIEKVLINEADCTVSVSDKMHSYYEALGAKKDFRIFLSADVEKFSKNSSENKKESNKNIIKFCYVGALSEDGWHKPSLLSELFFRLKELFPFCKLSIVTTSPKNGITQYFEGKFAKDVEYISTKTTEDLCLVLSRQDVGMMSYFIPKEKMHIQLAEVLLAIKTVEYLAGGLPIICNKLCGVSGMLEENRLGLAYDPLDLTTIDLKSIKNLLDTSIRNKCKDYAAEYFDINKNAKRYQELYKKIKND